MSSPLRSSGIRSWSHQVQFRDLRVALDMMKSRDGKPLKRVVVFPARGVEDQVKALLLSPRLNVSRFQELGSSQVASQCLCLSQHLSSIMANMWKWVKQQLVEPHGRPLYTTGRYFRTKTVSFSTDSLKRTNGAKGNCYFRSCLPSLGVRQSCTEPPLAMT